ncbi:hypothetical protein [Phenylobacterium sp.]|jgi:hypothetical protein|uniref:hypothetical protein n=1 Tax=Phenylobacterium sp. TaxID=1871053 RepID=UPI002F930AEF
MLANEAVSRFAALSSRPYFRSAIMKAGLDEMCQRFVALDGISREELAAHLIALGQKFGARASQPEYAPAEHPPGGPVAYFGPTPLRN